MNGKSNVCNADREADPVAKFGEQLSMPHEVMANLPFIATHKGADSIYAEFGARCRCLKNSCERIGKIGSCSFFPMCARSTKIRFRCQSQRAIEVVDRFPSLEPWKSAQQERKPNATNPR
jgi:hypothetical protein